MSRVQKITLAVILAVILLVLVQGAAQAAPEAAGEGADLVAQAAESAAQTAVKLPGMSEPLQTMQVLLLLTVISIAPAILVLCTAFTRIAVVLGFLRTALGTPQLPPNQVLVGLALFLTAAIMSPTIKTINADAVQPYLKGEISQAQVVEKGSVPLKQFMLKQTRQSDLGLMIQITGAPAPQGPEDVPFLTVVPAFAISELKTAFTMGFVIFLPFVIIDFITASTLMSMGMMMVPPVMVSLPFKILLFVLVDGWHLVVQSLFQSFAS